MIQIHLHGGGRLRVSDEGALDLTDVTPAVLAYGLAHVTRFGGQVGSFSVAEHSVRLHDWLKSRGYLRPTLRFALLHDAAECLGEGDTQRFVKRAFECSGLQRFGRDVSHGLFTRWEDPDGYERAAYTVKMYDRAIGAAEARVFGAPYDEWDLLTTPDFAVPKPACLWDAARAEWEYQRTWNAL